MKKSNALYLFLLLGVILLSSFVSKPKPKVLVFSKTAGYHHASIANGIIAIEKIGTENNFETDTTTNAAMFTAKNLKNYAAIIFLSTTGDLFDTTQKQALQDFVHHGGGIVGVHAATDCEYNWPWFGKMMGAYFDSHPKQQDAKLKVIDKTHKATKDLPEEWNRFDEWYNFKTINPDIHVLITLDETSYQGGKNGTFHPVSWYQNFEGGRVFYTALGHTEASYTEALFLKHLLGGIFWVIGKKKN